MQSLQGYVLAGNRGHNHDPRLWEFRRGFNSRVNIKKPVGTLPSNIDHEGANETIPFMSTFKPDLQTGAQDIIGVLYCRKIRDSQDIIEALTFDVAIEHADEVLHLFEALLQHRLIAWLRGRGHVDHAMVRSFNFPGLTADVISESKENPTLRADIFFHAVSERPQLPVDDFTITVRVYHTDIGVEGLALYAAPIDHVSLLVFTSSSCQVHTG